MSELIKLIENLNLEKSSSKINDLYDIWTNSENLT